MAEESTFQIQVIAVTALAQNCMLVSLAPGGPAIVIDPGGDVDLIQRAVADRSATVEAICITHGHFDHVGGLQQLAEATGAPVFMHPDDEPMLRRGRRQVSLDPQKFTWLADGDTVEAAGLTLRVLHTPGHSPGSVSYLTEVDGGHYLFAGDLLFAGSVGRTDLGGGSFDTLETSIEEKVWPLPDETVVLPGHGPPTTVGHEKRTNPFVGAGMR